MVPSLRASAPVSHPSPKTRCVGLLCRWGRNSARRSLLGRGLPGMASRNPAEDGAAQWSIPSKPSGDGNQGATGQPEGMDSSTGCPFSFLPLTLPEARVVSAAQGLDGGPEIVILE